MNLYSPTRDSHAIVSNQETKLNTSESSVQHMEPLWLLATILKEYNGKKCACYRTVDLRESKCYWFQPILFSLQSALLLASGVLTRSIVISRVNTSSGGINQQHLLCQFMATENIDHSDMCYVQKYSIWGQYGKLQYGWGLQSICLTNQLHYAISVYFSSHK